jgi:hypothetical protein
MPGISGGGTSPSVDAIGRATTAGLAVNEAGAGAGGATDAGEAAD